MEFLRFERSVHGANFLAMAIDTSLSSTPYILLHSVYLFLFGLTFVLWSYVFYAAGLTDVNGNRFIYSVLDWSKPKSAAKFSAITLFVMVPLLSLCFWVCVNGSNQVGKRVETTERDLEKAFKDDSQEEALKEPATRLDDAVVIS